MKGTLDNGQRWKVKLSLQRFDTSKNSLCSSLKKYVGNSDKFCKAISQAVRSVQYNGQDSSKAGDESSKSLSSADSQQGSQDHGDCSDFEEIR